MGQPIVHDSGRIKHVPNSLSPKFESWGIDQANESYASPGNSSRLFGTKNVLPSIMNNTIDFEKRLFDSTLIAGNRFGN